MNLWLLRFTVSNHSDKWLNFIAFLCGLWLGYLLCRLPCFRAHLNISVSFRAYLTWGGGGRQLQLKHSSEYENHFASSTPLLFTLSFFCFSFVRNICVKRCVHSSIMSIMFEKQISVRSIRNEL